MKFLSIDEEGYFLSNGIRWEDSNICLPLLQSLKRSETGAYVVHHNGEDIGAEAFNHPLVVHDVEPVQKTQWRLRAPYGYESLFNLKSLSLDEWDRFHGRTEGGISFVFSRSGQARFFETLDAFDDESITWQGEHIHLDSWPSQNEAASNWQLKTPHPAIESILAQMKLNKSRIFVLDSGRGQDAIKFTQAGHFATQSEPFALTKQSVGSFDVVFDHTSYCSIPPLRRNDLVRTYRSALHDQGLLVAIFPLYDNPFGPPFAVTEWEIRERCKKDFQFLYWTRTRKTVPERLGQELIVVAQKKS